VWQWPVRMTHWCNAYSILILAVTGLYMGHPFITVSGPAGQHFVMGWTKTIHFYAAIVFALSVVSRLLWMFMGNRYSTWDKFIPVARRRQTGLWDSRATTSSSSASRRGSSATTPSPAPRTSSSS
jgi:Ni,Fe-hydrogenase I cytochrome b subunit